MRFTQFPDGIVVAEIDNPFATATISLYGGTWSLGVRSIKLRQCSGYLSWLNLRQVKHTWWRADLLALVRSPPDRCEVTRPRLCTHFAMGGRDSWREMVCVESANALGNVVTVKAHESHTLAVNYSVQSL